MRNLKRALSLALASVMLLGMMVVGSSAAFADADEIVNTEAVEITAGLGLFAGSDGKFNPKGNVTRAQMATVIVKMLYGSEINADQYKGINKFSDVAAFEGGWAEGYINLCASLNIVGGYGDGTFKPGQAVTTAEAVTMIINALAIDAGEGTWPMTVMAKAEEIELFADMKGVKPATNVAMTRDQLAVVVWNGLNYSAEGVQGYKVAGSSIVFKTWSDAAEYYKALNSTQTVVASAISEVKGDTLADSVFEITTNAGVYVTGNQATGLEYTELSNGVKLNLETGLDMLGHYVTAYYAEQYKNENNPGVAYCVVDLADYVKVAETIAQTDKKDYLAAFGTKVESVQNPVVFDNKGYMLENGDQGYAAPNYSETNFVADAGTYVIDSESGVIVAFIKNIAVSVEEVTRVTTTAGKETIRVGTTVYQNNEDSDVIVEYAGIAEDDIVVVKNYLDSVYYLEKLEAVSGKITKTGTIDGDAATYIDGTAYINGNFNVANGLLTTSNYTPNATTTYDAYIYGGKLVGVKQTSSTADLSAVVYVVNTYTSTVEGAYGTTTPHYYAQGIDASGKEVNILIGIAGCVEANSQTHQVVTSLNEGFYTFEKSTDKEQAKKDVMVATSAKAANAFDADVDEFFAGAGTTITNGKIEKSDKYITVGGNRVYLTADTQYIVVEKLPQGITDELEIATYTGGINKTTTNDTIAVAATEDENGNKMAAIVIINTAAVSVKAEDYIYVVDGQDFSVVEGGFEYNVYFTATNEFKSIVVDTNSAINSGFYGDYTIDEEGLYTLTRADYQGYEYDNEEFAGIFGTSVTTASSNIDLNDAANAVIVDVRDAEWVEEDSEVAAIESLKDVQSALKAGYKVFFNVLLEDGTGTDKVITHIFITSVKAEDLDGQGNGLGTWHEA